MGVQNSFSFNKKAAYEAKIYKNGFASEAEPYQTESRIPSQQNLHVLHAQKIPNFFTLGTKSNGSKKSK